MSPWSRERRTPDIDLGSNHELRYIGWAPDCDLNPQYDDVPDVERFCASITHLNPAGEPCEGCVTFDGPVAQRVSPKTPKWTVESWEPLTISPSVLCQCGDHGFIRDGKWVSA